MACLLLMPTSGASRGGGGPVDWNGGRMLAGGDARQAAAAVRVEVEEPCCHLFTPGEFPRCVGTKEIVLAGRGVDGKKSGNLGELFQNSWGRCCSTSNQQECPYEWLAGACLASSSSSGREHGLRVCNPATYNLHHETCVNQQQNSFDISSP